MAGLSQLFDQKAQRILLDGGLGTTLEDVFHVDISSPVWSAKPIDEDPEVVIQAHLSFLRAGARIIDTASYQCAFVTFEKAGYTADDARRIMRKSVRLAAEARTRFVRETEGLGVADIKIALSLAAFGSMLPRPHEFDGFYPPPFGPQAYAEGGANRNSYRVDEKTQETMSIDALTDFHLQRLRVFANDAETWKDIDCIAFETIPLAREIEAIRRAMTILHDELQPRPATSDWKPWWVSTVWPNGQSPEESSPGERHLDVKEVIEALFREYPKDVSRAVDHYARPDVFGINCTTLAYIPGIVNEAEKSIKELQIDMASPWLMLKPNGGQDFDLDTRMWGPQQHGEGEWVKELTSIVDQASHGCVWGGIMAGGCCKTGPEDIRALASGISTYRPLEDTSGYK